MPELLDKLQTVWVWLKLQKNVIGVLGQLLQRIEAVEAAAFRGHVVHQINVPHGTTPRTAWAHICNGETLEGEGTRHYILTDHHNNVLEVLK